MLRFMGFAMATVMTLSEMLTNAGFSATKNMINYTNEIALAMKKEIEIQKVANEMLEIEVSNEVEEITEVVEEVTAEINSDIIEEVVEVSSDLTEELVENDEEEVENNEKTLDLSIANALPNEKYGWYFNKNDENLPPTAQKIVDLEKYDSYYLGDTENPYIYLTFDEGYENGYTGMILDTLKEKEVTAAFFVTKPYIAQNIDLINRMVDEGHIVANHSVTHPSFPTISSEQVVSELVDTADYYKEVTGHDMPLYFRPPMGEYSERTLEIASQLGYKTIFWSFAYKDWLVDQQPGKQVAHDTTVKYTHNGAILLLHAVSQSNAEAMGDIIDSLKSQGYEFLSLYELPE